MFHRDAAPLSVRACALTAWALNVLGVWLLRCHDTIVIDSTTTISVAAKVALTRTLHLPKRWICPGGTEALQVFAPLGSDSERRYPLVAFAHGMAVGPDMYFKMLSQLSSHGFVVIAQTAGQTGRAGCDIIWCEDEYKDVETAIRVAYERRSEPLLSRIDWELPVSLMGHSMGGLAVLIAATRRPPALAAVGVSDRTYGAVVAFSPTIPMSKDRMGCEAKRAKWPLICSRRPDRFISFSGLPRNFTRRIAAPVLYASGSREWSAGMLHSDHVVGSEGAHAHDVEAVLDGHYHDGPVQSVGFTDVTAAFLACHVRKLSAQSTECRRVYTVWQTVRARAVPFEQPPPLAVWCPRCRVLPGRSYFAPNVPVWQTQPANASCLQRTPAQCAAWTARQYVLYTQGCDAVEEFFAPVNYT